MEIDAYFQAVNMSLDLNPDLILMDIVMPGGMDGISAAEKIEERLKESEQRFKSTFEQAAVGICHVGTQGKFLRVNARLAEIVGYSSDEMTSFTWQDITHPDDLEADLKNAERLLNNKADTYSMEERFKDFRFAKKTREKTKKLRFLI